MSRIAVCSISKGIDSISRHSGTDKGFEPFATDHINRPLEQTCDILLQSDVTEHRQARLAVNLNHDIEVAAGPVGATRHRTEYGGVPDTAGAQIALVTAQGGNGMISIHVKVIPQNHPYRQGARKANFEGYSERPQNSSAPV